MTHGQCARCVELAAENKTLFDEHRIAMNLLRENTMTMETVAAERDRWKRAYEDAISIAELAIRQNAGSIAGSCTMTDEQISNSLGEE